MQRVGIALSSEITVSGLLSAFYYDFPENFGYEGASHAGWEFVYVEKGRLSVRADNQTYILKAGEMACHKPYEYHMLKSYHGKASAIIICFECDSEGMNFFEGKILAVSGRQKLYLNDVVANAEVLFLPKDPNEMVKDGTMERSESGTVFNEQYVKNAIELLILSLIGADSTERSKRIEFYRQHRHRKTLTKSIIEYLTENLAEDIKLTDISERFSYSLSSVKRIFKSETGYSIIEYLNNLRIEKAKELLISGYSVDETAASVGFANIYYFSNVFKNKTGITPSKFKKQNIN